MQFIEIMKKEVTKNVKAPALDECTGIRTVYAATNSNELQRWIENKSDKEGKRRIVLAAKLWDEQSELSQMQKHVFWDDVCS